MRVVVFGATGFTGRLVVAALLEMGVRDVVLGARDARKLAELSSKHGGLPTRVADATRPETLGPLCEGAKVVVDTAGPFLKYGEPVVGAAIEAGAHFLDTTGEQAYIANVLDRFDARAKDKGVAVVDAMAFEFALGCACAALLAESDPTLETIDVFNRVSGMGASRGTQKSALAAAGEPMLVLRGGRLVRRPFEPRPTKVKMPGSAKVELAVPFPGSEALFLHTRYPHLKNVSTNLVLPAKAAIGAMALVSAQPALRALAGLGALEPLVKRVDAMREGPTDEERREQHFKVLARGRGHAEKTVMATGVDPYGITGVIAALGAKLLLDHGPKATGVVSPDQAFGAKELLDRLEPYGVRVVWS
ncbi:MAG TPA: saccharopine dehydrogenase NADP-binding domain-containing protein [Minicystis sp.]|nr:saccharopine dehydrogenase NADP-binding domain-containing protein [Minicystis sp.]